MIGILGGTFDPIHNGHIHIAKQVVERLGLVQLQLMPCALPVHRGQPHASAADRCAMIELAIEDEPALVLNRLELEREGPSYSVDSLLEISQREVSPLVMVLGADAFNGFKHWKSPADILTLANLVVCARPGIEVDASIFPAQRVVSINELTQSPAGSILLIEIAAPDCSSSTVRAALVAGNLPGPYIHPAVAEYINQHHLYRNQSD